MTGADRVSALDFGWISKRSSPPVRWDLRTIGWRMHSMAGQPHAIDVRFPILVDWRAASRLLAPIRSTWRRRCLIVGARHGSATAALLANGYGDAIPSEVNRGELAQRLARLARRTGELPRQRQAGPLTLDLFQRDACKDGRWLALHPREFALLWRLAEADGATVPRSDLLADVWRLAHDPGTNRVEVHISRLRAKLAHAGCTGLVATDPEGGYRLFT